MSNGHSEATPLHSGGMLVVFVSTGVLLSMGLAMAFMLYQTGSSTLLGLFVAMLGPLAALLLFVAAREGMVYWVGLWRGLRWWHLMWFLLYVSAMVWRARLTQETANDPLDAWSLLRIGPEVFVAVALLLCLALRRPREWISSWTRGLVGCLFVFGIACVTTTIWSVYWPWTLYKSLEYQLDVALLALILAAVRSTEEYETLLNWTWTLIGLEVAWVWMQVVIWPADAFQPVLEGVGGGERLNGVVPGMGYNAVGGSGAVLAIIALARLLRIDHKKTSRVWYVLLFLAGVTTMLASQTRSALGGFMLGVLVVLTFSGRRRLAAALSVAGALVLSATSLGPLVWSFLARQQTGEQLVGLTGRVQWWTLAWDMFTLHPWGGVGAYAAGKFAVFAQIGSEVATLHSDYMEVLVGTSVWGFIPVLTALLGTWWFLRRYVLDKNLPGHDRQLALETLGVLAVITVRSVVNVELTWHCPVLFLSVLGYAELRRRLSAPGLSLLASFRHPRHAG